MDDRTKFRGKYRVESARLKNYDYSSNGAYFVTICTGNREHFFGEIVNGAMKLSEIGEIAKQFWREIETLHNFIILDEWIVMPNHVHGIIFIQNPAFVETRHWRVSTFGQLQKQSIPSIINHYKGITKKWANKNKYQQFCWQKKYYDHVVRSDDELNRIREYIFNNPANWENDQNNISV